MIADRRRPRLTLGWARRTPGHRPGTRPGRGPGTRRGRPRRARRRRWPRLGPRFLAAIVGLVVALAAGWLWLRDSSLVAVQRVTVSGVSGPDAHRIRTALSIAAHGMSTLDVQMSHLQTAVAPYPVVKRLLVSTQFPHGMRIRVIEEIPVAMLIADGERVAVAGDGALVHDAAAPTALPAIYVTVPPAGTRVTGDALDQVKLLAAAPYALLAKIQRTAADPVHGLIAELRNGPRIYFGNGTQLGAKWAAAVTALADPRSAGAAYIDVSVPRRPVAGVGSDGG